MPNANKKKNLKPKKYKVQDAMDFAKGFALNYPNKDVALASAKNFETVLRQHSIKAGLTAEEMKEAHKTANFWSNIIGHINKL